MAQFQPYTVLHAAALNARFAPLERAVRVSAFTGVDPSGAVACDAAVLAAMGAARTAGMPLLVDGVYRLAQPLLLDVPVQVWPGCGFRQDAALTIAAPFHAAIARVFHGAGPVGFALPSAAPCAWPEWWGAVADGQADCADALDAWFAALRSGIRGELAAGTYLVRRPLAWDVAGARRQGVKVTGAGGRHSVLSFDPAAVVQGPALLLTCGATPGDHFYTTLRDFGIEAECTGPAFQAGRADYGDPLNVGVLENLVVSNGSAASDAVGAQLNYVVNSRVTMTCNTGGAAGQGTALELRQSAFNLFLGGSYGNARVGVHLADGYCYGNGFLSVDVEEVQRCVVLDTANARANTWVGGTFVYRGDHAVFVGAAGPGQVFDNVNVAPVASGVDSASFFAGDLTNVLILEREGGVATPPLPASGTWLKNATGRRVLVTVHDGLVTEMAVRAPGDAGPGGAISNPVAGAVMTRLLNAGWSVRLTYTGAAPPAWLWEAAG